METSGPPRTSQPQGETNRRYSYEGGGVGGLNFGSKKGIEIPLVLPACIIFQNGKKLILGIVVRIFDHL